jgi:tripartite-type tricarboxylate transporter receptor subunit TctC
LGGQVQAGFLATPGVLPHVQNSRLKALAISSDRRSSVLPDVPTVAESGYPAFQVDFHLVILAPAGLPEPIRALLEREVRDIMETAEVKERLHTAALEPLMIGGSDTAILLKAAAERWRAVVKTSNIQPE